MDYDDYLKQNPEFAARAKLNAHKYTCATCHKGFDKPKTKSFGSFWLEVSLLIASIILWFIFPIAGIALFVITVCLSLFRSLSISKKKICPYCGSPYFTKNK